MDTPPKPRLVDTLQASGMDDEYQQLPLGDRIRFVRQMRRHTHVEMESLMTAEVGDALALGREMYRRLETGAITEERANPMLLAAVAGSLGMPLAQLAPSRLDDAERLCRVLMKVCRYDRETDEFRR